MKRSNQFDRTTRDIVNAFLDLLEEKSFEKIIVQDIVDAAMINRSTFYQHFADKYAILEYLQQKYITEFKTILTQVRNQKDRSFSRIDLLINDFFLKNSRQLKLLLKIRTEHVDFQAEFKELFCQLLEDTIVGLSVLERNMIAGMFMEFFTYWLSCDDHPTDFARAFYTSCLNLTMACFQLEGKPQAKQDFLDLIGKYETARD